MNAHIKTWVGTIVTIIIAITIGVFVWVYEKGQPEITQPIIKIPAKKQAVAQTPTTNPVSQNYIEVKELGFKIPIDTTIANEITYKIIKPLGVPYSSAEFDSKTDGCEGGFIDKISGTLTRNVTGESAFYENSPDVKQFDGFFLHHGTPQAVSCDPAKYGDVQQKIIQAISTGFKNISLIDQSDTVSDWQTYNDDVYGFSIQYPTTLSTEKNGLYKIETAAETVAFGKRETENFGGKQTSFVTSDVSLSVFTKTKDIQDIQNVLNSGKSNDNSSPKTTNDKITIDGVPALKVLGRGNTQSVDWDEISFIKDNKAFVLSFNFGGNGPASYEDTMVSSFKFTK